MAQTINGMSTDQFKKYLHDNVFNRKAQDTGFFPLPPIVKQEPLEGKVCNHPEHKPPMHLHIPQGQGYRHVCPLCGETKVIIPPQISM